MLETSDHVHRLWVELNYATRPSAHYWGRTNGTVVLGTSLPRLSAGKCRHIAMAGTPHHCGRVGHAHCEQCGPEW